MQFPVLRGRMEPQWGDGGVVVNLLVIPAAAVITPHDNG
jgi:hypothetical protein